MTLFLFVKQFTDILYQYQILDYLMAVWVLLLLVYQIVLVRPDFKKQIIPADWIVGMLAVLLTVNLLRFGGGYQTYFKVLSAFLMYFVGRVYYDRIKECYGALVSASYIVVYLNLFERIRNFGFVLTKVVNADGDLYHYDTDMAFAMILAMVFIAMFGKNTIGKLITIFAVCPYMVLYSDAGIQVMLMLAVYAVMLIYLLELVFRKQKLSNGLLTLTIAGLLGIVTLVYLPVLGVNEANTVLTLFEGPFLNNANMQSLYYVWEEVLEQIQGSGPAGQLFGIGMGAGLTIRSLYIKVYYSLGYAGLLLTLLFVVSLMYYVVKIEDRKTFYLAVIMAVLLLGTGVAVNSMETTQMSWFPLLFAGMVVSSVRVEEAENKEN